MNSVAKTSSKSIKDLAKNPLVVAKKIYVHFNNDSLYRNSIYLILSTAVLSFFGFFFWILNARLFTVEQVGIATTLISIITLLSQLSLLGFNVSLIRYLPKSKHRNEIINSACILILLLTAVISVVFISFLNIFSPKLVFMKENIFYLITFTIFVAGMSLNTISESVFTAYRATGGVLFKNFILSLLKLVLPISLIFMGSYGIFSSFAIATLVSALIGFAILSRKHQYLPALNFNLNIIKEISFFSAGNYIAGFLALSPSLILPILIINRLSAEVAAYYYISTMILGFLAVIATGATQSLLAEGSHETENLKNHLIKASRITFALLIPAILVKCLFGNILLSAFGSKYAEGAFTFLRIISISSVFMSISLISTSVLKILHKIPELIISNMIGAILVIGLSYLFISYGLVGVGLGWLAGQIIFAIFTSIILMKELSILNAPGQLIKHILSLGFKPYYQS